MTSMSQEKLEISNEKKEPTGSEESPESSDVIEFEEYERKRNELLAKKRELEKFFGKKMDLGQAEEELKWLNEKTGRFQKEAEGLKRAETETDLSRSATVTKKEVLKNKEIEEKLELLKETLILMRRKIADNLKDWKQIQEKSAQDNLEWGKWIEVFQDIFSIEEIKPRETESISQWSRRTVQQAYQKGKLDQLVNNLKSL